SKIGFGDLILLLRYFFKLKVSTHPNKLYLSCTMVGSVSYGEYGLAGVTGIATKRVGNTVYVGYYHQSGGSGVWGDTLKLPYYLYVAYIP
ncbi:hypothetical protein ABTI94_06460, partial [Acinetobacter baumannii]